MFLFDLSLLLLVLSGLGSLVRGRGIVEPIVSSLSLGSSSRCILENGLSKIPIGNGLLLIVLGHMFPYHELW